jgi:hypothetical protein
MQASRKIIQTCCNYADGKKPFSANACIGNEKIYAVLPENKTKSLVAKITTTAISRITTTSAPVFQFKHSDLQQRLKAPNHFFGAFNHKGLVELYT